MPPFEDIRILLLQARNTPEMEHQEQQCFLERARLAPGQIVAVNVTRDPIPPSILDGFGAFMIGGAGEYSATDDHDWFPPLFELLYAAYERAIPTFGSCWGHQVIARAFGGEVVHDTERAEIGTGVVTLTDAGREDPLFGAFPPSFRVNMGHHDRVTRLPEGAVELAFSASQPNQAFRMGDRPMYGTQFHSELDATRERERLVAYREYYAEVESDAAFNAVFKSLADTTEADHLLHDFLRKFVVEVESGSGAAR